MRNVASVNIVQEKTSARVVWSRLLGYYRHYDYVITSNEENIFDITKIISFLVS